MNSDSIPVRTVIVYHSGYRHTERMAAAVAEGTGTGAVFVAIGDACGISFAAVALAWLLAKPYVTSVIIGVKRIDQLEENLGAVNIVLTDEELARREAVSALPPYYPGWMVNHQDANRHSVPFIPLRSRQCL
ncbi:hypothetical protein HKW97_25265 (plasmid) [Pseudomonas luteola]|uniref:aldo/keto reductase n=1 Tax=Pseudomonas luteola TaxID=47886 RepID=UPI00388F6983